MNRGRIWHIGGVFIALFFVAAIVVSLAHDTLFGRGRLDVVAAATLQRHEGVPGESVPPEWVVNGRVMHDGRPVERADVWAIATDLRTNRYSSLTIATDSSGQFVIGGIPYQLAGEGGAKTALVEVHAKTDVDEEPVTGKHELALSAASRTRKTRLSIRATVSIPLIFVISIISALIQVGGDSFLLKLKYYGSVGLAFVFAAVMIVFIAIGMSGVTTATAKEEVLSLGFANIFHGTYVSGAEKEWLLSLTSPSSAAPSGSNAEEVETGFGAPLWVLLISVVGAGVFTISLIVSDIKNPIAFDSDKTRRVREMDGGSIEEEVPTIGVVRERVQAIVTHQFYILFAPLGSLVVYQLLVMAGAASEPVTVGLTALAAGVALQRVLGRALQEVQKVTS